MILPKKRILIAEDDASIRRVVQLRLEHEGFIVVISGDGEEALREAEKNQPIHLVLLDIKMPKLDGYTVCRRLRCLEATANVPVLIITASESSARRLADRCIEAGASGWIQKPFQTRDLMNKIQQLLNKEETDSHG